MPAPVIQPSFAAGEISPDLYGRVDFAKYHTGLKTMRNFIVDYKGGAISRPGWQFVGRARTDSTPARLIPFQFSTLQAYVLVFTDERMRVVKDGAYVLEPAVAITGATQADPVVITAVAHGFSNGNWVYIAGVGGMTEIDGRMFLVTAATADTFSLRNLDGDAIDGSAYTAYTSGGTASRVFTLTVPWAADDLRLLKYTQNKDVLTVTHPDYPPYDISRTGHASWSLTEVDFRPSINPPVNLEITAELTGGSTTHRFLVTSVSSVTGEESRGGVPAQIVADAFQEGTASAPQVLTLTWDAAANADRYNVYRQPEVFGLAPDVGALYGFIGSTTGTSFNDTNILPDFSRSPPEARNPFAQGTIASASVTDGGSDYSATPTVTVSDPTGTGAAISATVAGGVITGLTVDSAGANYTAPTLMISDVGAGTGATAAVDGGSGGVITSIAVLTGGSGYVNPIVTITGDGVGATATASQTAGVVTSITVTNGGSGYFYTTTTITDSGGTGATGTVTLGGEDNYPGCVCYFQQRKTFAASNTNPETFWMTQPGLYRNMDVSTPTRDSDAITGTLASQQVNAIRSMVPMPSGLVLLSSGGAWQVTGGQGQAITPASGTAQPQTFDGASDVQPVLVGSEILYVQDKGSVVRDLSYNFYVNTYVGTDVTVLSTHLFFGRRIVAWCYANEPYKAVWAVRDDGILLTMTFLKDQEVYGWSRHDTAGLYEDVCSISEGQADAVYALVRRYIGGAWVRYIERLAPRTFGENLQRNVPANPERAWCVDSGLAYTGRTPEADLTASAATGAITFTASTGVFETSDVGAVIRFGGGKATITARDSATVVQATVQPAFPIVEMLTDSAGAIPLPQTAGNWSVSQPVTQLSGLDHLEGETVSILADGSVVSRRTVTGGTITLPYPASYVVAGLGFQCQLQTLAFPDASSQTKRKRVSAMTTRIRNGRGLLVGRTFDDLVPQKQRTDQPYGTPIPLETTDLRTLLAGGWDDNAQICMQIDDPVPCIVTADVIEIDIGDR